MTWWRIETFTTGAPTTTVSYFARREDFDAGDFLRVDDNATVVITDVKFTVRWDTAWREGVEFIDDYGERRRIVGVSEIGRRRYQQLLARAVG